MAPLMLCVTFHVMKHTWNVTEPTCQAKTLIQLLVTPSFTAFSLYPFAFSFDFNLARGAAKFIFASFSLIQARKRLFASLGSPVAKPR
jgi:hypothetical protein